MSVNTKVRYQSYTEYDGFSTGRVFNNEDGSQYVQVDNGDHFALIWVDSDTGESVHIKDQKK